MLLFHLWLGLSSDLRLLGVKVLWALRNFRLPVRCYVAKIGSLLRTFRDRIFKEHSLNMGPICYPETSVTNHQSTLRNLQEERKSQDVNILYFSRTYYAIRQPHSTQFYLSNIRWTVPTKDPLSMQLYPAIRYLLDPISHILGLFCTRSVARFLIRPRE
jgi:hypothetical protein